jgi:hypothetical protein
MRSDAIRHPAGTARRAPRSLAPGVFTVYSR